jgi:hypothetical protein
VQTPPPPAPSSTPPAPRTATPTASVSTTFTIRGALSDFDADAFREQLLSRFPSARDAVVRASAGSVVVDTTLTFASEATARSTADAIRETDAAAMRDDWFGGTLEVEAVTPPTVSVGTPPVSGGVGAVGVDDTAADSELAVPSSTASQHGAVSGTGTGGEGSSSLVVVAIISALCTVAFGLAIALIVCRRRRQRGGGRAKTGSAFQTPGRKQPKRSAIGSFGQGAGKDDPAKAQKGGGGGGVTPAAITAQLAPIDAGNGFASAVTSPAESNSSPGSSSRSNFDDNGQHNPTAQHNPFGPPPPSATAGANPFISPNAGARDGAAFGHAPTGGAGHANPFVSPPAESASFADAGCPVVEVDLSVDDPRFSSYLDLSADDPRFSSSLDPPADDPPFSATNGADLDSRCRSVGEVKAKADLSDENDDHGAADVHAAPIPPRPSNAGAMYRARLDAAVQRARQARAGSAAARSPLASLSADGSAATSTVRTSATLTESLPASVAALLNGEAHEPSPATEAGSRPLSARSDEEADSGSSSSGPSPREGRSRLRISVGSTAAHTSPSPATANRMCSICSPLTAGSSPFSPSSGAYTPSQATMRRGSRDSRATVQTHVFDRDLSDAEEEDADVDMEQSPMYI